MTESVGKNNIQPKDMQFQLDHLGNVRIESIKDEQMFDFANQVDADHDGLLENEELVQFIREYSPAAEGKYRVYDEQRDENGN